MIGTKLAHYEITGHLGTGGMGEVYQANDSKLSRNVAIKLLPGAFAHDIDRAARFGWTSGWRKSCKWTPSVQTTRRASHP